MTDPRLGEEAGSTGSAGSSAAPSAPSAPSGASSRSVVQRRSRERRQALLDAAVEIVIEKGLRGLTHRGVATRAGVPPATTGYYFATVDALIEQTLLHHVEARTSRLGELLEHATESSADEAELVTRIATGLVDGDSEVSIAQYEVYVEATRRPVLRQAVARTTDTFAGAVAPMLTRLGLADPQQAAFALVAAADGLAVHRFSHPIPREVDIEMTRRTLMGIFAAHVIEEERLIELYRETRGRTDEAVRTH